jgi:hypothetical protein
MVEDPGSRPTIVRGSRSPLTPVGMPGILGRVPDAAAEFSSSAALPILREACQQAGLGSDGAELLRIGENANFRLASAPLVVRISGSADRLPRVTRELCVARWLATAKVPAVRVADEIEQPLMVDGHPVTFWHAAPHQKLYLHQAPSTFGTHTNDQEARPPSPAIRPLICNYLVAGAGFEPATSGL